MYAGVYHSPQHIVLFLILWPKYYLLMCNEIIICAMKQIYMFYYYLFVYSNEFETCKKFEFLLYIFLKILFNSIVWQGNID